jgi:hypothetical protein
MTDMPRVWTISLVSLIAAAVSVPIGVRAAAPPAPTARATVRLDYTRGPGAGQCPDREAVRAEVTRRLGFDPFSERGERALRCEIRADGPGLRAQIEVQDAEGRAAGQRVLTSRRTDCSDLMPGLLLVLTVAATPPAPAGPPAASAARASAGATSATSAAPETSAGRTPVPAGASPTAPAVPSAPTTAPEIPGPRVEPRPVRPRPETPRTDAPRASESPPRDQRSTPPSPPPPTRPAPIDANDVRDEDAAIDALVTAASEGPTSPRPGARPEPPSPPRRSAGARAWYAGAGVLGGLQTLPRPSWGGDLTLGLGTSRFSIALDARFHAPRTLRKEAAGSVTAWTAAAWIVPCARYHAFAACALVGAGVLQATGSEVAAPRTASSPWLAAGARAELRLPLAQATALTLRLDGYAVPLQTVLQLGDPPGEVWRTPRVAAALAMGFVHQFRRGP